MKSCDFSNLIGETLTDIQVLGDDEILFSLKNGKRYKMYHEEDCCESVSIEDISGIPLNDLIGDTILKAEVRVNEEEEGVRGDSVTWTFYELATIKGSVTIRWFGSSNGYYSERVDFVEIED